ALWGTAQDVFSNWQEPLVLALSSPPYALAKQRAYGNPALAQYVDFIVELDEPIVRHLAYGGSIVLNLSQDCFEEGSP
ncbi:site-specific DNA-methyltransferase, partial [Acinetobacter baumannii]